MIKSSAKAMDVALCNKSTTQLSNRYVHLIVNFPIVSKIHYCSKYSLMVCLRIGKYNYYSNPLTYILLLVAAKCEYEIDSQHGVEAVYKVYL